jgi:NADH dehydrogenase
MVRGSAGLEDGRRRPTSAGVLATKAANENDVENVGLMTFVIVGAPAGVELAGAIGELAHSTLKDDFRNIDPKRRFRY